MIILFFKFNIKTTRKQILESNSNRVARVSAWADILTREKTLGGRGN